MAEATKGQLETPEVPKEVIEANPESPHGDDVRKAIEQEAMVKNEEIPVVEEEVIEEEAPKKETEDAPKEDAPNEEPQNDLEKIKKSVHKRIGKLTAKAKTLEEQLAERDAEIERLRKGEVKPEAKAETTEKREPTMEECRKALAKAFADGDHEFAAQITEYMAEAKAKAQREEAERVFQERSSKQTEAQKRQQEDWINLNRDYEVTDETGKPDLSNPMTLANQQGLLYQTALGLFKDPEVNSKYVVKGADGKPDTIMGFRLAVNDAYRGLIEQGHYQPGNKIVNKVAKPNPKRQLAVPDSDGSDEPQEQQATTLSDAEKARQEIKSRMAYLNKRMAI